MRQGSRRFKEPLHTGETVKKDTGELEKEVLRVKEKNDVRETWKND